MGTNDVHRRTAQRNIVSAAAVLVTSNQLSEPAKQVLRNAGLDVTFSPEPASEAEFIAALAGIRPVAVLMRGNPPMTRAVMESAPQLKIIAKHGAGVDSVDLAAAAERGIAVMTAGAANADAVAELSLSLMLALSRELPRLDRGTKAGDWQRAQYQGREFRGRSVGILGYGQIGRRVARLAAAFGAQVIVHSRSAIADAGGAQVESDLDALLRRADILSLHCPLTPQTRGIIGRTQLQSMPAGALLINTARGALVDEDALVEALRSGHLGGAGLDTFATEPPDPGHALLKLDNVICTPHIAGATRESLLRVGTIAATNIVRHLRGEAPDPANKIV
jgi:D-3-phosphoglycerate dehydrogenase / 2-oxoglutarate reductase